MREEVTLTRNRRLSAFSAAFVALALVAASCGGDDSDSDETTAETTGGSRPTPPLASTDTNRWFGHDRGGTDTTAAGGDEEVPAGGTLVIGMEQEGDCMDWISSCGGTSWTYWAVGSQTMPRAFDTVKDGDDWVPVPAAC